MAKQSFHTAKPDRLVGRELEMETVNQFVRGHMTRKTAGSLYISGAPGTGKTARQNILIPSQPVFALTP
jgi:cell division control protein 6